MFHGVATLMARSLRLEARLLRTHLFRLVFVFFIYMMMSAAQIQSLMRGAPGLWFFTSVLVLNLIFVTGGGLADGWSIRRGRGGGQPFAYPSDEKKDADAGDNHQHVAEPCRPGRRPLAVSRR